MPERVTLGGLVLSVAAAMHAVEWVDSGDYGPGDEIPTIRAALGDRADQLILDYAIQRAKAERDRLEALIKRASTP
jgi:hypothetical protein